MTLTQEQLSILQHAYGADEYGLGGGNRNHYCAGGDDVIICAELVSMGLMQTFRRAWLPYYNCYLTKEGIAAMRAASPLPPKVSRAKLRYQRFLQWADAFDGTFREFLEYERAREAAR